MDFRRLLEQTFNLYGKYLSFAGRRYLSLKMILIPMKTYLLMSGRSCSFRSFVDCGIRFSQSWCSQIVSLFRARRQCVFIHQCPVVYHFVGFFNGQSITSVISGQNRSIKSQWEMIHYVIARSSKEDQFGSYEVLFNEQGRQTLGRIHGSGRSARSG